MDIPTSVWHGKSVRVGLLPIKVVPIPVGARLYTGVIWHGKSVRVGLVPVKYTQDRWVLEYITMSYQMEMENVELVTW